ncbi:GntR family transcriptional regulator [Nocardia barduliensis]|uniref:GntR family transcriptional regulator n=1 Tax=Nocardia barduliensis TaxID=2736643 RepID=UPI001572294E|nr:GntR family transcriptional regulator [Nocardia barduliensis]
MTWFTAHFKFGVNTAEVQDAQHTIRRLLQAGVIKGNETVDPGELSSRLGIPRRHIASALSNLEAEGILERRGGRTIVVRVITEDEISEILAIRHDVESRVAEQLARIATDEDIDALRQEIDAQRRAAVADERILFMDHAAEFHCLLAERARFIHAARIMRTWQDLQRVIGVGALHSRHVMLLVAHEHADLVDFIEAGDEQRARELATQHLLATAGRLNISAVTE